MYRTGKLGLFNAAYILRFVRDSSGRKWEEFLDHFKLPQRPSNHFKLSSVMKSRDTGELYVNNACVILENILGDLINAGFIVVEKDLFIATPLVEKVQNALDISLSELSKLKGGSILANPFFGFPKPLFLTPDVIPDVFVLMPFSEALKPVYEDHIKTVLTELGLKVMRADDMFASDPIIDDIWSLIYNSKLIIADCTGRNPNVFYEIGIAHTIGSKVILISQNIEDIPFDLRHIRCIVYQYNPRGMSVFNESLRKTLTTEMRKLEEDA
jgi:hypothetical protein